MIKRKYKDSVINPKEYVEMKKKKKKHGAKKPHTQFYLAGLILIMAFLMAIPLTSAVELNPFADSKTYTRVLTQDMSNFIKADFNSKYGVITLNSNFMWIDTGKIAEYSLISTSESIIDIGMQGKVTLYKDGTLFDNTNFKDNAGDLTNLIFSNYFILVAKDNYVDVPIYKEVCDIIPANEKNGTKENKNCYQVVDTYKKENQPIQVWEKYNKEILIGNYEWKFEGKRNINQIVDVLPVKSNKELSEWIWYNSSWTYRKKITITGTVPNNYSAIITITNLTNMNNDFSDLRFVDNSKITELPFWIDNKSYFGITNTTQATAIVKINNNNPIYMYYGNKTAVTTKSNFSNAFLFADDFLGPLDISKWNNGTGGTGTISISGGIITFTTSGGPNTANFASIQSKYNVSNGYNVELWERGATPTPNNWAVSSLVFNNPTAYSTSQGGGGQISGIQIGATHGNFNPDGASAIYGESRSAGAFVNWDSGTYKLLKYTWNSTTYEFNNGSLVQYTTNPISVGTQFNYEQHYSNIITNIDYIIIKTYVNPNAIPTYTLESELTTDDLISLSIILISPTDAYSTKETSLNFLANATISNGNLTNGTLFIYRLDGSIFSNNITNSLTGVSNQTNLTVSTSLGNYLWNVYACGKNATSYLCQFAPANRTLTVTAFTENSLTFNTSIYDLFYEGFALDITYDSSIYSGVTSYLNYNGTNYLAIKTGLGDNIILSRNIYIPPVDAAINKSFYFWVGLTNINTGETVNISSSTGYQYISPVNLIKCNATYNKTYINFTLKNELDNTLLNGNFFSTFNYRIGGGTTSKNYSYSNNSNSVSNFDFCFSLPYQPIVIDMDAGYSATGYSDRTKYLRNASISNATSNIDLLLLNQSSSVKFFIKVTRNLVAVKDAIVVISKYNTGTGLYQTIGSRKTDDTGKFIEYLEIDKTYQFAISKNLAFLGLITKTSTCAATPCEFELELAEAEIDFWSGYYDIYATNIASNLTYNRATKMITYRFVDLTGLANYFRLEVNKINYNQTGENICNQSYYATAGQLNCNLTGLVGDFRATSYISRSPERIDEIVYIVQKVFREVFGYEGLFFAAMIIMLFGLIGAWNPVVGVLLGAVAFFFVTRLGLIEVNYTIVVLIFCLAIFIIIKMGGRTQA